MPELSSLRRAVISVLADGEFHSYAEVYLAALDHITPEMAVRRYLSIPRPGQQPNPDLEVQAAIGSRRVVSALLDRIGAVWEPAQPGTRNRRALGRRVRLPGGAPQPPVWAHNAKVRAKLRAARAISA